jgi:hypothetical protein
MLVNRLDVPLVDHPNLSLGQPEGDVLKASIDEGSALLRLKTRSEGGVDSLGSFMAMPPRRCS